jgi:hypothetical protein
MEPYLFHGIVLPERAPLSIGFEADFVHFSSGVKGHAKISILLNQISIWIDSEQEWDVFDLRNVVKTMIQNYLAMIGYLRGYAYDVDIVRVLKKDCGIDRVFGIDIPCLSERTSSIALESRLQFIMEKATGKDGIYLNRCFNDLISAMKNADDTGFYCYRAIEALRHHCTSIHNMSTENRAMQWKKFRDIARCDETIVRFIEKEATPLRHGEIIGGKSTDRANLLTKTWEVVDGYLKNLERYVPE